MENNIMKDFIYIKPKSLAEAIELRLQYGKDAVLLNGGTDIVIQLREQLISPKAIIDIKGIAELEGLSFREDCLYIGALTTLHELSEDETVRKLYPYIADAAAHIGSRQIRSRATCVGNIVNASPLCDMGTPLYAADAIVLVSGKDGSREIPIAEFITFVRRTSLKADEIVIAIKVPLIPQARGEFIKIARRSEVDLSSVCATILKIGNQYRLAFGAVAPTPMRLSKVEALLEGQKLTPELIEAASKLARTEVKPISDIRSSLEYRLDMVETITKRTLEKFMNGGSEA
jgi:carbon-monoxide dehydrogenase medium subunit